MRLAEIKGGKLRAEHLRDPQLREDIMQESRLLYKSDGDSHLILMCFEALGMAELEAQDARTLPLKHRGDWTHYRMYHDLELSLNTETGETSWWQGELKSEADRVLSATDVLSMAKNARKTSAKVKHGGPYSRVTQFLDEWIQARTSGD